LQSDDGKVSFGSWADATGTVDAGASAVGFAFNSMLLTGSTPTEEGSVQEESGDNIVRAEIKAKGDINLTAGRDIQVDYLTSKEESITADAGRSVGVKEATAAKNLWVSARLGSNEDFLGDDGWGTVSGKFTTQDGWAYVWAARDISGSVEAKKTVSATAWQDLTASLTSSDEGVEAFAKRDLTGAVTGNVSVDIEAGRSVNGEVKAGDETTWGDVSIRAGGWITQPVTASGSADVAVVKSVLANVTATEGSVTVVANDGVYGAVTAGAAAEVFSGSWVEAVTATQEVVVEASAGITGPIESRESYVSIWSGGAIAGSVKAAQEVLIEAKGDIVTSEIAAGTTACILSNGGIYGVVKSKWGAELRSLTGVYPTTIETATLQEIKNDPDSPTNRRLAAISQELANPALDPARRADLLGEQALHNQMLQSLDGDGFNLSFDPNAMDAGRVDALVAEGRNAMRYDGAKYPTKKGYVLVTDVVGQEWYYMILEPYGTWEEKQSDGTWLKRSGSLLGNYLDDPNQYRNIERNFYKERHHEHFPLGENPPDATVASVLHRPSRYLGNLLRKGWWHSGFSIRYAACMLADARRNTVAQETARKPLGGILPK
jgi:hypothetical protein